MMTPDGLDELTREIMALGYDEKTAGEYAVFIGDTPRIDADGFVLVCDDDDKVLARLKLKSFN